MEWTNEKYLNFIEDYRKARVLWDIRNPNYKNNSKKRKILMTLGQKYSMDEGSLRKKIKNLRSAFHREHHRLTNKLKGAEHDDGIRKWFAYDSLKFILDVTGPFTAKREELSFSTGNSFQHEEPGDDQESFDVSTQYIQLPQLIQEEPERSETPENVQNPTIGIKEEDEYDLFGRSMTMQLRKLPELLALDLMQKMQFMVFNAKKQLNKDRNKRKLKLAKQAKLAHNKQSTCKKKVRPNSSMSHMSPHSTSPTGFKFETMSPEADTTRVCNVTDRDFTYEYVTAVEDVENYTTDDRNEDASESNVIIQRQLKRKLSKSIDPLEVNQIGSGTRIKHK